MRNIHAFTRLLRGFIKDTKLSESLLNEVLSKILERAEELSEVLVSGSGDRIYIELANLYSLIRKKCGDILEQLHSY